MQCPLENLVPSRGRVELSQAVPDCVLKSFYYDTSRVFVVVTLCDIRRRVFRKAAVYFTLDFGIIETLWATKWYFDYPPFIEKKDNSRYAIAYCFEVIGIAIPALLPTRLPSSRTEWHR